MSDFCVALIGNPNSGKTTLFNVLTGAHQKVGNWPGVTVEKKMGRLNLGEKKGELIDLPGIYSLEQDLMGIDEKIARDFLETQSIDLIINIVDASNLDRNLVLTQQLLGDAVPVVVVLNMLDVAKQQGHNLNAQRLSEKLDTPVFPVIASKGLGIKELETHLTERLSKGGLTESRHEGVRERFSLSAGDASEKLIRRYHESRKLMDGVVEILPVQSTMTEKIDRWVLNRWLGVPFFLLMIYVLFTVAINLGSVFVDFFDILFGALLVDGSDWLLSLIATPPWMLVLVSDGLGGGIQLVATFIPVIGFLYLGLSVLEDSGYLSRAAFVVDRLMAKIGLPGNAFVPLIVGFGCNVPSVMAARALGNDRDRLLTIAMAPYMSCGARLTVYALFATALFPSNGQNIVFLLYLLGIVMAVLTGFAFRRQIFSGEVTPSVQEMPAYHVPVLRNILITTWFRLKGFIFRAGKTIVIVVMVLSFFNSFAFDGSFGNENTEKSSLSVVGKAITPLFAPVGVKEENWPATVGLFTGLFAKEAVVGTLDALYSGPETADKMGAPDLGEALDAALYSIVENGRALIFNLGDPLGIMIGESVDQNEAAEEQGVQTSTLNAMATAFGTPFAAFCYLVLVLLYSPCVAVLGSIAKETGLAWMSLVFCWTFAIAYITASCLYQLGTFMAHPLYSTGWILASGILVFLGLRLLKYVGKKSLPPDLIPVVQV